LQNSCIPVDLYRDNPELSVQNHIWVVTMIDRIVVYAVSVLILFNVGKWLGAVLTGGGPHGGVLAASLAGAIWIGYLAWHSNLQEQESDAHRFVRRVVSLAVSSFLLTALGFKE
jgi:hypothetical protein